MKINELLMTSGLTQRDDAVMRLADGTRCVYLHAGQLLIAAEPTQITTVLGSCVAICLWDPALRIGGMNHYMLPMNPAVESRAARFADSATEALMEGLLALGASLTRVEAKVYGGACVLGVTGATLGDKNIQAARQQLSLRRIPIVAEDVAGSKGRKVVFRTDTGLSTVRTV